MALFNIGKKKEEEKPSCCCGSAPKTADSAGCCCGSEPKADAAPCCCGAPVEGICCVKVLGLGCRNCHAMLEATKEAVQNMGLNIEVEYVTDMEKIAQYGVMRMPALVVIEKVASMGKVLKAADVELLLHKLV